MNNFVSMPKTEPESNNNIPKMEEALISPVNTIIVSMPPKPIKKRFVEYHEVSIKGCARSILNDEDVTQDSGNAGSQVRKFKTIFTNNFIFHKLRVIASPTIARNLYELSNSYKS